MKCILHSVICSESRWHSQGWKKKKQFRREDETEKKNNHKKLRKFFAGEAKTSNKKITNSKIHTNRKHTKMVFRDFVTTTQTACHSVNEWVCVYEYVCWFFFLPVVSWLKCNRLYVIAISFGVCSINISNCLHSSKSKFVCVCVQYPPDFNNILYQSALDGMGLFVKRLNFVLGLFAFGLCISQKLENISSQKFDRAVQICWEKGRKNGRKS